MLNAWAGSRRRRRSRCWSKPRSCGSGLDVVEFGAGEPDFADAGSHQARRACGDRRRTSRSTRPRRARPSCKQAICARYKKDYGIDYTADEVIVTAGGKQALYNVAIALFGPGNEVITHAPCWPTHHEQVKLADATPVLVQTYAEDGFAMHADAFLHAVTPNTQAIIINSPCNPTGALMAESELHRLIDEVARRRTSTSFSISATSS